MDLHEIAGPRVSITLAFRLDITTRMPLISFWLNTSDTRSGSLRWNISASKSFPLPVKVLLSTSLKEDGGSLETEI